MFFIMEKPKFNASKADLWAYIRTLEGDASAFPAPAEEEPTFCVGTCDVRAQRSLQFIPAWGWRLRITTQPGHLDVKYCPWCGKELGNA